jgi:hypothetical protein
MLTSYTLLATVLMYTSYTSTWEAMNHQPATLTPSTWAARRAQPDPALTRREGASR